MNSRISVIFGLLGLAFLAACQSNSPRSRLQRALPPVNPGPVIRPPPDAPTLTRRPSINDPDASRLHDIEGAILYYYLLNKRLPEQLSDLAAAVVEPDIGVDVTSPVTGRPYVYIPEGLAAPGKSRRIILYDDTPLPNGSRWCLFMSDLKPGAPSSVDILAVPDSIFRTYHPLAK